MALPSRSTGLAIEPALLVGIAVCVGLAAWLLVGPMPTAHGGASCSGSSCGAGPGGGSGGHAGASNATGGGTAPQGESGTSSLTIPGWVLLVAVLILVVAIAVLATPRSREPAPASASPPLELPNLDEKARSPRRAQLASRGPARAARRWWRPRRTKIKTVDLVAIAICVVLIAWLFLDLVPAGHDLVACHVGGTGTKSGGGSGTGGGTGSGSGKGSGSGTGGGTGSGSGKGSGSGSGGGNGTGSSGGTGSGSGGGNDSGSGKGNGTGSGGGTQNGSANQSRGANSTGAGATPQGQDPARFSLTIPVWAILVMAVILSGIIAVWATSRTLTRRSSKGDGRPPASPGASRGPALGGASDHLVSTLSQARKALGRTGDPRTTIVWLYGQLLAEVDAKVGGVTCSTAEEIRVGPLRQLGVRPPLATFLTRLFETARYSTHPIGKEAAGKFGEALQIVQQDLVSVAVAG